MRKIDAQITPTPSGRAQCLREASWLGARRVDTKLAGVRHCEVGLRSAHFGRSSEGDLRKCLYENELFDTFAHGDFFERHFIVSRKSQRSTDFCSLERKIFFLVGATKRWSTPDWVDSARIFPNIGGSDVCRGIFRTFGKFPGKIKVFSVLGWTAFDEDNRETLGYSPKHHENTCTWQAQHPCL